MDDFGESIGSLVVVGLMIWGGFSVWNWAFGDSNSDYQSSYSSGSNSSCTEPENPYDEGSGHYAGWQWGEEGNDCNGSSSSFIEGCEEYQSAEATYEECL